MKNDNAAPLMELKDVKTYFKVPGGTLKAVNGVSLSIREGETIGLVGESGCGKSTTGRLLIRLLEPTSGRILYKGEDIARLKKKELRSLRQELQIIFQDPFSSLNPRMTCMDIITEPLLVHQKMGRRERQEAGYELLNYVGLPREYALRFPHEFSGAQRQRIGIARALALKPRFIVCDEPVSALDVSVQSQVLNLISKLQQDFSITYLFIAHGLNVVKYISDRVGVMYLGSLVELADSETIYREPLHPYTQSLISAIPDTDVENQRQRILLQGDVPSPSNMPSGCPFHTRCRYCEKICKEQRPEFREVAQNHFVACHKV